MGGGYFDKREDYESFQVLVGQGLLQVFQVSRLGHIGEFDSVDEERVRLTSSGTLRLSALSEKGS
jgi:hypothetical protein